MFCHILVAVATETELVWGRWVRRVVFNKIPSDNAFLACI